MRFLVVLGCAAAVVLAACGSSGDGAGSEGAVRDALERAILSDPAFASNGFSAEDAVCVARRAVETIGAERLRDVGLDGSDEADLGQLTDTELAAIGEATGHCVPAFEDFLVTAIAEGMLAEPDPQFPVTEEQAHCVAGAVADDLGPGRLIVLGVRADVLAEMDDGEAETFAGAMFDCLDLRAVLMAGIAGAGVPEDMLDCLDAEISDDDLRELFTASLTRGELGEAEALLDPAVEACT